ncbi:MAG: acyltransferase, partial [Candidatus Velamenicoccus archaeovorus]
MSEPGPVPTVDRVRMAAPRLAYLDNLKTLLIAGIIAGHAFMGYAEFGSWTYQDVQEVTLSPVVETVFVIAVFALGGLFLMALFFLISGLLTEGSLVRKGQSRFVADRLWRLGVPFAVSTLVVWPLLEYALLEPFLHRGSYWRSFADTDPVLDSGPMWFVGVLLLYSLALVAWRRSVPPAPPAPHELRWRDLGLLSLVVGLLTFAVRIVYPADSNQALNAHVWAWPEYIAMFGLGVAAARHGWLRPVPRDLASRCGIATIVVVVVVPVAIVSSGPLGLEEDAFFGGWGWPALLGGMSEGLVAISAPVWLLAVAQRHLGGTGPLRRAMARASYLAFMVQGPVLVGLMLALRKVPLPGD